MSISSNLLYINDNGINKDVVLSVYSKKYSIPNYSILTYYKNNFQTKKINELSDGMSIFGIWKRKSFVSTKLNKQFLVMGMSIFQDFDEDSGKMKVYLNKFPKISIEEINSILVSLGVSDYKIISDGKFIILDGKNTLLDQIFEFVDKSLKNLDFDAIFSFLFGVCLVYGDFQINNDVLKGAKIHIPLEKYLIKKQSELDNLFDSMANYGIFNNISLIQKTSGYVYQISILDNEILASFVNYMKKISGVKKDLKSDIIFDIKTKLTSHIQTNNLNLENRTLDGIFKVLTK